MSPAHGKRRPISEEKSENTDIVDDRSMNRKYGMVLFCIVLHYVACLFISLAFHVTLVNISLNIDDSGRTSWWKETGPSPGKPSTIDRLLRGLPGYDMR